MSGSSVRGKKHNAYCSYLLSSIACCSVISFISLVVKNNKTIICFKQLFIHIVSNGVSQINSLQKPIVDRSIQKQKMNPLTLKASKSSKTFDIRAYIHFYDDFKPRGTYSRQNNLKNRKKNFQNFLTLGGPLGVAHSKGSRSKIKNVPRQSQLESLKRHLRKISRKSAQ